MEIPLFPLQTVLYPAGRLPLRIFEARYVDMTKACIRDEAVFGVCLIRAGEEAGAPAVPVELGCTARIVHWDVPAAGLFSLLTEGEQVFRVERHWTQPDGLIRARVQVQDAVADAPLPPAHRGLSQLLRGFIDKLGAERFPSPLRLDDALWVSRRLAELLPLSPRQKLQLLETREPLKLLDELDRTVKMLGYEA